MAIFSRAHISDFVSTIGKILESLLNKKREITIAVPGGSTPILYLDAISKLDLDWERINIFLTDERWVETTSNHSNEKQIRDYLLRNNATRAKFYGIYQFNLNPATGAAACSRKFKEINSTFDLVILGMGSDTHIASIFPGNIDIYNSNDIYAAVTEEATLGLPRVTLTPTAISHSVYVVLAISGIKKENSLASVWESNDIIDNPVLLLKDIRVDTLSVYSLQDTP